jgi:hypothetical protein
MVEKLAKLIAAQAGTMEADGKYTSTDREEIVLKRESPLLLEFCHLVPRSLFSCVD